MRWMYNCYAKLYIASEIALRKLLVHSVIKNFRKNGRMLDRGGQFDIENGARLSAHMAAVAQLVEPLVVVQVVAGSNPVGRPILLPIEIV